MATLQRNQLILAGIILAGLLLLSTQLPSLAPWFVGWLLAGAALSFAYKRRQPMLILVSLVALIGLIGLGLYPRWKASLQTVETTASYGKARQLTEALVMYGQAHAQRMPAQTDAFWTAQRQSLGVPALEVVPLPHRAGLLSAAETLPPDPAKANGLTIFVAEGQFFVIVPRDATGKPAAFAEDLSNLKKGKLGAGEARAVDQSIPGNQAQGSDGGF